jgi:hypothetical protein
MSAALRPTPDFRWVPTGAATQCLGISGDSLRRYARKGALRPGVHYRPGVHVNSPWQWQLTACAEQLFQLGALRMQLQLGDKKEALADAMPRA